MNANTNNESKELIIDFRVQEFTGFYSGKWSLDDEFDNAIDDYCMEHGIDKNKLTHDCGYWHLDREEFDEYFGTMYAEYLQKWYEKIFGKTFTFEYNRITHPKEYNFANDALFLTMTIKDKEKFFKKLNKKIRENYDMFCDMVANNHTSYSGFMSYMSNDADEWIDNLIQNDTNHPYLECAMEYIAYLELGENSDELKEFDYDLDCAIWYDMYNDGCYYPSSYIRPDEEAQQELDELEAEAIKQAKIKEANKYQLGFDFKD